MPALLVVRRGLWRHHDGGIRLTLFDDAMISMSYARTLAEGAGLVWYPGAPRVEGITNLGWTLFMAGLHRLGPAPNAVVGVVVLTGLALVWAAALVARHLARSLVGPGAQTDFLVVVVVAANFPLLYWSLRGMEVGAVTLVVLLTVSLVWAATDDPASPARLAALAAVGALGVFIRTDVLVVSAAASAWVVWARPPRRVALLGALVGGPAAALAATTLFRLSYYGHPLPNTYYLKVEGIGLATRLVRGAAAAAVAGVTSLVPLLVVLILFGPHLPQRLRRFLGLCVTVAGGLVAYSVYVGGDAWEGFLFPNRYLTPAVVVLSVAAVVTLLAVASPQGEQLRLVLPGVVGWLVVAPLGAIVVGWGMAGWGVGGLESDLRPPFLVAAVAVTAAVAGWWWWVRSARPGSARASDRAVATGLVISCLVVFAVRIPHVIVGEDGVIFARVGAQLAEVTRPSAVVAVSGAGGSQYFSRRPMVDLLGKSDPVIAMAPPASPTFIPGHDKYDLEDSIRRWRPDAIADIGFEYDPALLHRLGYEPMARADGSRPLVGFERVRGERVIWVRSDSPLIRRSELRPLRP